MKLRATKKEILNGYNDIILKKLINKFISEVLKNEEINLSNQ